MLILDTISGKPIKDKVTTDGELYLDISVPVTGFEGFTRFTDTVMVTAELRMRPDAISSLKLGEQNKMDYLLKYNSIDNPFSIDSGDVLAIPAQDDCRKLKNVDPQNVEDIRNTNSSPKRASKKDQNRLEFIKKMAEQDPNGTKEVAPPNFAPKGSKEIKDVDGVIKFGPDVTAANPAACEPKSKAELKAKLLQKNIFKKPGN